MRRWLPAFALTLALGACDQQGRPLDWPGLDKLKPGQSTELDVRQVLGLPDVVVDQPGGGKLLQFPKGPEGVSTFFAVLGPDGKLVSVKNVLTHDTFNQIKAGMSRADALALLGRPAREHAYPLKQQVAMEWTINDSGEKKLFVVTLSADGKVVSSGVEPISRGGG